MRKIFALTLFFMSPFGFAASTSPELKMAIVQEWNQFNPVTVNLASTEAFLHFLLRPMVVRSASGEVLADLAEAVPTRKNGMVQVRPFKGKKKIIATWKIRNGAKWGDGQAVTCKDWLA